MKRRARFKCVECGRRRSDRANTGRYGKHQPLCDECVQRMELEISQNQTRNNRHVPRLDLAKEDEKPW